MADKKYILVVDDDRNITDLTKLVLESAGHECAAVNSGRECLKQLESKSYDLVLLDVAMPGFSGIDVVNAIKQKGLLDRHKIVFFTASSAGFLEESELKKLGVLDCFKKPFSKKNLLERIETWLY